MTTHKTKVGKSLIEMTPSELIDEIAHLRTTLDRVVAKNKRRRKALKELNKFALVRFKLDTDVFYMKKAYQGEIAMLKETIINKTGINPALPNSFSAAQEAGITHRPSDGGFFRRLFGGKRVGQS